MRPILAMATAALLGTSLMAAAATPAAHHEPGPFHGLKFRDLGPAVAGGRVTSVTAWGVKC